MRSVVWIVATMMASASLAAQQTPPTQTPVPKPTPIPLPKGATASAPPSQTPKPGDTATPTAAGDLGSVDPRLAGIAGYPNAEFLGSYDAGTYQKLFMFGTNETYDAVVAFYKTQFKKSGEEISRQPRIQQFEFSGAFNSSTMSQRPSVIVKDYTAPDPEGYLHVSGTTAKRFKTLIQIIPITR